MRATPRSSPSAANVDCACDRQSCASSNAPTDMAKEPSPRSACARPFRSPHRSAASSAIRCSRAPSYQCPQTLWYVQSTTGSCHAWASNPARGGEGHRLEQHLVLGLEPGQRGRLAAERLRRHSGGGGRQGDQLAPRVEHHMGVLRRVQVMVKQPPRGVLDASGRGRQRRLLGRVGPEQVVERVPPGHGLVQQRRPHQVAQRHPRLRRRDAGQRRRGGGADVGSRMQTEQPEHPRRRLGQVPVGQRQHGPDVRRRIPHVQRVQPPAELGQLRRQRGQRQPRRGGGPRDDDGERQRQPGAQRRQLGDGPRLGGGPRCAQPRDEQFIGLRRRQHVK